MKRHDCSDCLDKAYQIKIDYGHFCGYQTFVLSKDQTAVVIDSLQGAPDQAKKIIFKPFTTSPGVWGCCGKNEEVESWRR